MEYIKSFKSFLNETLSKIPVDFSKDNNIDKQILRAAILAELDAINLYEQMSENAKNQKLKRILLDVAKEEKTHIGEFQAMLKYLDNEYSNELINGEKEINEKNSNILSLKELRDKYPEMIFNMTRHERFKDLYNVTVYIKTQGGEKEYLGGIKGPSSKANALRFLNGIAETEYDKYY